METGKIIIKEPTKDRLCVYIKMVTNSNGITIYNYYNGYSIDTATKSTFNKASFIEYLKSIQIPKKYIKMVENY